MYQFFFLSEIFGGIIATLLFYSDPCKFFEGFVQDGTEILIGKTNSEQQCAELALKEIPTATGVTWYGVRRHCYAEFGNNIVISSMYRTCLFRPTTTPGNILMKPCSDKHKYLHIISGR